MQSKAVACESRHGEELHMRAREKEVKGRPWVGLPARHGAVATGKTVSSKNHKTKGIAAMKTGCRGGES